MWVGGQCHAPEALPPRTRSGTPCTRGCMGPSVSVWTGVEKLSNVRQQSTLQLLYYTLLRRV